MSSASLHEATAQGSALCLELGRPALLTDQRQMPRVEHQPWGQPPATARQAANTRRGGGWWPSGLSPPTMVGKLPTSVRATTPVFTHHS